MKKKVKSLSAAKALALGTGAVMTGADGLKFNSGRAKTTHKRLLPADQRDDRDPEQIPVAKPQPDPGSVLIAEKLDESSARQKEILASIVEQLATIKMQYKETVLQWEFEFVRGKGREIEKIVCSATKLDSDQTRH